MQELLLHMHPLAALVFLGLVLASIVATPWWDRTIDPGLLAGFPTLISNGLIPLLLSLGGLAIIYDGLLRILRANQSEALLALLELGAASLIYMKPRSLEGEFGGIVTDLTLTSTASIFSIFRGERNQVFCVATAGGTEIRKNLVSTPDY